MRISRRGLGTLTGVVVLGVLAGCSEKTPEEASGDRLEWLGDLDGVEKAELVPDPGSEDHLIRLTLVKAVPEQTVRKLVDTVKRKFERYAEGYDKRIELAIDGFHGRFSPSALTKRDADLERALWLRRDGRATSSTYGPSSLIVTAPPAAVAAVALGFDQVARDESGRRMYRIEDTDRQVAVQWDQSPGLGFRLNRVATQNFVDLGTKYPNLTGWIEEPEHRAGIYFAASDIGLDALLAALPKLVNAGQFGDLELGWGPARAPDALFVKAFTPRVRMLLGHLLKIPGVTELRFHEDDGVAEVASVTVRDRAGYVAARNKLREVWDDYLSIQLVRGPSRLPGRSAPEVFRSSIFDGEREFRTYEAVADLAGVAAIAVGLEFSNLTIARQISDRELDAALKAMAGLPASQPIHLFVSNGPDKLGVNRLGRVEKRKFLSQPSSGDDSALAARVGAAWGRVS